jgi:hypothetical protein
MKLSALSSDLRRFALVLGGEGLQSGLHFALNLAVMAMLPGREYGAFAFVLVLGGVGITYLRSLTALPAANFIGRARRARIADFHEGGFTATALALSLLIGAASVCALWAWSPAAAESGAAVVALWSFRSHLRGVGFARREAGPVMIADAAFAATGALASFAALRWGVDKLDDVLLALAFANLVGCAAFFVARRRRPRVDFGRRARRFYFGLSRRLVWSLYSVTATILQGQGVAFLTVAIAGPAAFAPIAAMLAFFAPLRIFAMSLSSTLQPEISRVLALGDEAEWRSMRGDWTLRALLVALLYGDVGFAILPRLHMRALAGAPVIFLAIAAWTLYAVVLGYLLPRFLLEARMRYREIALVTTLGSALGLGVTTALLQFAPTAYAILGAIAGEGLAGYLTWRIAGGPLKARAQNLSFRWRTPPQPRLDAGPNR